MSEQWLSKEERDHLYCQTHLTWLQKFWQMKDSHDACERALREAQSASVGLVGLLRAHLSDSAWEHVKQTEPGKVWVAAEERIERLESALRSLVIDESPLTPKDIERGRTTAKELGLLDPALAHQPLPSPRPDASESGLETASPTEGHGSPFYHSRHGRPFFRPLTEAEIAYDGDVGVGGDQRPHAENCNTNRLRSNEPDALVCNCGAEPSPAEPGTKEAGE